MSAYCNNGNHHWRMRGKEKVISKCCDKIHHRVFCDDCNKFQRFDKE